MSDVGSTTCEKCGNSYTVDHCGCPQRAINAYREEITSLRAQLTAAEAVLDEYLGTVKFNTKTMLAQLERIGLLESQLSAAEAEIKRLRNILNTDELHDPELAAMVGKPMNIFEAAVMPPRQFNPRKPK